MGSHVWVLFPQVSKGKLKKLYRPWSGPFIVFKRLSDVTYKMSTINVGEWSFTFNHLKPYKQNVRFQSNRKLKATHKSQHTTKTTLCRGVGITEIVRGRTDELTS